jgi:hypothetical protein
MSQGANGQPNVTARAQLRRKLDPGDYMLKHENDPAKFARWFESVLVAISGSGEYGALIDVVRWYTHTAADSVDAFTSLAVDEDGAWNNPFMEQPLGATASAAPVRLHEQLTAYVTDLERGAGGNVQQLRDVSAMIFQAADSLSGLGVGYARFATAVAQLNATDTPIPYGDDDAEIISNHKKKHDIITEWRTHLKENPIDNHNLSWKSLRLADRQHDQFLFHWFIETLPVNSRAASIAHRHRQSRSFTQLACDLWKSLADTQSQRKIKLIEQLNAVNAKTSKEQIYSILSDTKQQTPTVYDTSYCSAQTAPTKRSLSMTSWTLAPPTTRISQL